MTCVEITIQLNYYKYDWTRIPENGSECGVVIENMLLLIHTNVIRDDVLVLLGEISNFEFNIQVIFDEFILSQHCS